ncbi:galactarate dehydratase [uncultured Sphaerochaeta sp.]|uniref:galactarate dehydratase n=1 Tax=uncultured Sphaerochaeta sp. TaxID=886478 RepID=UPI002A0A7F82|nr:galactarate dehydratase [uncultured Sphaerochaeta sp.]
MVRLIQIDTTDNVAILTDAALKGTAFPNGLILAEDIPQGHKVALQDLKKGDAVRRYGVVLGYMLQDVKRGAWINEKSLELPAQPSLDSMEYGLPVPEFLPEPSSLVFDGYDNGPGAYAGTRNLLAITTTVQCVSGVVDQLINLIRRNLLPKYPNVEDVVAINHAYGCGVAINAPDALIPIRSIRNIIRNPNFGGQIMVVGLGCEKLTVDKLLEPEEITSDNVLILQDYPGYQPMMDALLAMAETKLKALNARKRTSVPLSKLCIGMQCGGSDAFSGVTANPSAGFASDLLVKAGATVMFSEVTEVRDGIHLLAHRCVDKQARDKLASEIGWYDEYLAKGLVDRSANPTPGNKKGGLSNIVEKAMGSIAKSGHSAIVEVLGPGELPSRHGLIFAATPASDIVCGPSQLASGITLQVFMTGRGTPYGLSEAPVIKVCSRNDLKAHWDDLIDLNAGGIATGEETVEQVGQRLFTLILDVASGRKKTFAEQYGLHNFLCFFNPAPIT